MKKKLFLFVLCLGVVVSLASCFNNNGGGTGGSTGGNTDEGKAWYDKDGNYTYNDFIGGTTSMNWNPLSWETSDDSYVLGFLSMGFYDYVLNDAGNGWEVVCEMAASLPTDVTSSYVGQYGVKAGEKGRAWKIELNKNAKWENGEAITADDYIYSMKQQLDPQQLNRRADSYYGGDFSIVNAQKYLYNGLYAYTNSLVQQDGEDLVYADNEKITYDETTGQAYYDGMPLGFKVSDSNLWSSYSLTEYYELGYDSYFQVSKVVLDEAGNPVQKVDEDGNPVVDEDGNPVYQYEVVEDWYKSWTALLGKCEGEVSDTIPCTKETIAQLQTLVARLHGYASADAYAEAGAGDYAYQEWQEFVFTGQQNEEMDFSQVGLVKTGEYSIVIVIEKELANPSFYLPYYLSSTWLVNETKYEASWTEIAGKRVNTYMSSVESSISYGPYKLEYFEADKQITFTRNTSWYGYTDGKHEGQFQTDKISCQVIEKHETALQKFELGEVDAVSLSSDDLSKYGSSKNLIYAPDSYTTKLTLNSDVTALAARETDGVNKRILSVKEFREALSLCIDRTHFTSAFTAAAAAGYGLYNYMYQVVFEDGTEHTYRNFECAKKAILDLYGIEYGEGTEYETVDEAYRSVTGYDMEAARAALQTAYDKAVAAGLYNEGDTVLITFSVYSTDTIYNNMFQYIKTQLTEAAKGTSLEGKIDLEMVADQDYYETLYAGKTDLIFSTWGGATYGLLTSFGQIYTDNAFGEGNQMEYGFETEKYDVTIEVDGTEYTESIKTWANWLKYTASIEGLNAASEYEMETLVYIFSKVETAYLQEFCAIPLYYRQTAQLYSHKINYGAKEYVNLIGYGGIRHMTYNYTDEEWAEYIKGGLQY